jgi:hypothetical protein
MREDIIKKYHDITRQLAMNGTKLDFFCIPVTAAEFQEKWNPHNPSDEDYQAWMNIVQTGFTAIIVDGVTFHFFIIEDNAARKV